MYADLCKKINTHIQLSSKDNKGKHYIIFCEKKRGRRGEEEKRRRGGGRSPIPNSFHNILRVFFHSHVFFFLLIDSLINKEQASKEPKVMTIDFRKILLNRCQREFEQSFQKKLPTIDPSLPPEEKAEQELKIAKIRQRNLGNVKFIGDLFRNKMLSEKVIHRDCIQQLIQDQSNEDNLEYLCLLLSTIGEQLDHEKAKHVMDQYFDKLKLLSQNKSLTSRIRFKIQV
jgi:hypothetical protein